MLAGHMFKARFRQTGSISGEGHVKWRSLYAYLPRRPRMNRTAPQKEELALAERRRMFPIRSTARVGEFGSGFELT